MDSSTVIQTETESDVVGDNQKDPDVISIDAQTDVEIEVFWDAMTNPDTNTSVDMQTEIKTGVDWNYQTNPDDVDINAQTNMEVDVFWDAKTNVDEDASIDIQTENYVFWDVQTEVSVENHLEPSEEESVIIQTASSDDLWEIWNELNINKIM